VSTDHDQLAELLTAPLNGIRYFFVQTSAIPSRVCAPAQPFAACHRDSAKSDGNIISSSTQTVGHFPLAFGPNPTTFFERLVPLTEAPPSGPSLDCFGRGPKRYGSVVEGGRAGGHLNQLSIFCVGKPASRASLPSLFRCLRLQPQLRPMRT
jgi:hypothetical protein